MSAPKFSFRPVTVRCGQRRYERFQVSGIVNGVRIRRTAHTEAAAQGLKIRLALSAANSLREPKRLMTRLTLEDLVQAEIAVGRLRGRAPHDRGRILPLELPPPLPLLCPWRRRSECSSPTDSPTSAIWFFGATAGLWRRSAGHFQKKWSTESPPRPFALIWRQGRTAKGPGTTTGGGACPL